MAQHHAAGPVRRSLRSLCALIILLVGVGGLAVTGNAEAVATPATLPAGRLLGPGSSLASPNKFVSLRMQRDGNLVVVAGGHVLWSSRTAGAGNYLAMDRTGDLRVLNKADRHLWSTHTSGASNRLVVTNDGNLIVRRGGAVVWSLGVRAVELDAGNALYPGQYLVGRGGETLSMQGDGNLVLRRGATAIWDSHTNRHPGAFAQLQRDGNLVVYSSRHQVLWHIDGAGPSARLSVGPDGNVVLRTARGAAHWQTRTARVTTAATWAAQLLHMWGGKVVGLPGVHSDLVAASRNQAITNSCGHRVRVDPRLMQFLVAVTARYKIKINNMITGHGCDSGQHPKGRAADLGGAWTLAGGAATSFGGFWGPDNPAVDRDFVNYISTLLPNGAGLGQRNCRGQSGAHPRAGVAFFSDSCNHQHVQVP